MGIILTLIFISILLTFLLFLYKNKFRKQLKYLKRYKFQKAIKSKISEKYPQLTEVQLHLVFQALRDYFWMCHQAKKKMVAMPSQVVDDAWHEFILFTRSYNYFCKKALGRFLHHTPTEAMSSPTIATEGIKRAWRLACAKEHINPEQPNCLPLIFAIDSQLNIPNGFKYMLDCSKKDSSSPARGEGYCASHIGCSSGCVGDSAEPASTDSGGFFSDLFDGSGCGGGCGGD